MTYSELKRLIQGLSDDELAKSGDMVYQVWSDGEVTRQKCGDILWQRTLYRMCPELATYVPKELFPHELNGYGYIFTTEEGTKLVRTAIMEIIGL